jgi:hypothetical protein
MSMGVAWEEEEGPLETPRGIDSSLSVGRRAWRSPALASSWSRATLRIGSSGECPHPVSHSPALTR